MNRVLFYLTFGICLAWVSAWEDVAFAKLSACDQFGQTEQNLFNASVQQGFTSLNQPIVVGCGSTGLSAAQAQAQSSAKIQQYASWLASMQQLISQNASLVNCSYWQDANSTVNTVGIQQLQNLMSFSQNEPASAYCQAETTISGSPASVSSGYALPLACRQDGTPANGLRPCSSVIADSTSLVHSFAQKIIDGVYRGCSLDDPALLTAPDQCSTITQVPVCNYFDGITGVANPVSMAETTTNHLNRSCGSYTAVTTQVQGKSCNISNSTGTIGTMEQSHYQGNLVRALDCSLAQINDELAQGSLTLTAPAGVDPKQLYSTQLSTISSAQSNLLAHKNISHIEDCGAVSPQFTGSTGLTASAPSGCSSCSTTGTVMTCMCQPLQGTPVSSTIDLAGCVQPPSLSNVNGVMSCQYAASSAIADNGSTGKEAFQSSCQMFTQRSALEQQYVYLGMLEWVNRARRSFERFDAGNDGVEFFTAFKNYLVQQEQSSQCTGNHSQCNPTTFMNNCYIPIWNQFFVSRSNSVWNTGVCQ